MFPFTSMTLVQPIFREAVAVLVLRMARGQVFGLEGETSLGCLQPALECLLSLLALAPDSSFLLTWILIISNDGSSNWVLVTHVGALQ